MSIVADTPKQYATPVTTLNRNNFSRAISNHGYALRLETALPCPCRSRANGHARTDCDNCFGSGWTFFDPRETHAVIQHISQTGDKVVEYNKALVGHAQMTMNHRERHCGYMDRVTLLDYGLSHRELLNLRVSRDGLATFAFCEFVPTSFRTAHMFVGVDRPLSRLRPGTDFVVEDRRLTLLPEAASLLPPEEEGRHLNRFLDVTVSVEYEHHPLFHVVDSSRAFFAATHKVCADGHFEGREMPLKYVIAQPQYMHNAPRYDGSAVNDNSAPQAPPPPASLGGTFSL